MSSSNSQPLKWFVPPNPPPPSRKDPDKNPICSQTWSPAFRWSVDCKVSDSCWYTLELLSSDRPYVTMSPNELPFKHRPMFRELRPALGRKEAVPVKMKKYLPTLGAVNLPVDKFMAPPTLTRATSNGMGTWTCLKVVELRNALK